VNNELNEYEKRLKNVESKEEIDTIYPKILELRRKKMELSCLRIKMLTK
jgi:hypothetical protein